MLGNIIRQERIKRNMTATQLAQLVGVHNAHITHIEKNDRNPSKKLLSKLCDSLNLSYPYMLSISKNVVKDQEQNYDVTNYTPYDKTIYTENFSLISCPPDKRSASLSTKMKDDSMEPIIKKGAKLYIEYTTSLVSGDVCIILHNDKIIIRKFIPRKNTIKLIAENPSYEPVEFLKSDNSYIILGRILLD